MELTNMYFKNPESYAGGSLPTGRISQAREVNMGRDQTKRNTLVLQVGGWA
jgi:hypothetical protein